MEDRSTASKPPVASPSPSTAADTKPTASSRPLYSTKLGDQRPRAPEATASPPTTAR